MSSKRRDRDDAIPFESQRAMSTVALLTDAFRRYLDHNKCEFIPKDSEELDQFTSEFLDHVIVVGGFCRDILLNRKINDIDIIINLRELTKLQKIHLQKYHSKRENQGRDIKCAYWSRYMATMCPHAGKWNENEMVHNIKFILNADFWISILCKDERFENILSVVDQVTKGFISCEIVNTLKYEDVDLKHQRFKIIDTFQVDCIPDDHNRRPRRNRLKSMILPDFGDLDMFLFTPILICGYIRKLEAHVYGVIPDEICSVILVYSMNVPIYSEK